MSNIEYYSCNRNEILSFVAKHMKLDNMGERSWLQYLCVPTFMWKLKCWF